MESEYRGSDRLEQSSLTASDIEFPEASEITSPSQHNPENVPTASDIVCIGPSAFSDLQNSTGSTTGSSDVVFVVTSTVSEPQKDHGSSPRASDTVFAGASVFPDGQNQHENVAGKIEAEIIHSETQLGMKQELTANEEKELTEDQRQMMAYDLIKSIFELFDTDNDGYLTTDDLRAVSHVWGFSRSGTDLLQYAGPCGRIDFPNFLKLVLHLGIDLDKPRNQGKSLKFIHFVRVRVVGGFVPGSALRKLVIKHYINIAERRCERFISKRIGGADEALKWIFNIAFDEDGDGYLTTKELTSLMHIWEKDISFVHNSIITEVDAVRNGKIGFDDFLNLMNPSDIELVTKAEALKFVPLLKNIFNLLDEDDDGYISHKGVETFTRIWKTDPRRVENFTEDEVVISEDELLDFPTFFNLFPLRLNTFYLRVFKWDPSWLEYIFSLLDEDGDGCLSGEELKTFKFVHGMIPSEATYVVDKVEAFDPSKRTFNFSEALLLLPIFEVDEWDMQGSWTPVQHELITILNYAFISLDEDKDGRLSSNQVESLLRSWRLSPVSKVCFCRHGTISFPEFLEMLYSSDYLLRESTQDQRAIWSLIVLVCHFDEDEDGCLTREQVEILTLTRMSNLKQCDVQDILDKFDARGERTIDFPNLLSLLYSRHNVLNFEEPRYRYFAQELFEILDRDGDGYLSTEEVDAFARVWKLSPGTTQDLINKVDAEWNGAIDFPHLYRTMFWMKIDVAEKAKQQRALFDKLHCTFWSFGTDNDGLLTADQVNRQLKLNPEKTGVTLTSDFADGNELLDFDNFLKLLFLTDIDPEEIVRKDDQVEELVRENVGAIENEDAETWSQSVMKSLNNNQSSMVRSCFMYY